jgi:hypothetical protein
VTHTLTEEGWVTSESRHVRYSITAISGKHQRWKDGLVMGLRTEVVVVVVVAISGAGLDRLRVLCGDGVPSQEGAFQVRD